VGRRVWRYDSRPAEIIAQRQQTSAIAFIERKYVIGEPTTMLEALVRLELNGESGLRFFDQKVGEDIAEEGSRRRSVASPVPTDKRFTPFRTARCWA
jgi:hypothetical protein